jgi:hypothetical protein
MRQIYVYTSDEGTSFATLVDDTMLTSVSFGKPEKIVDDTAENRALYGLTDDNEPKVVNVLKSSQ